MALKYSLIIFFFVVNFIASDNETSQTTEATIATTVTTSPKPITIGAPHVPPKEPQTNLYTLKGSDGGYCIMLKASLRMAFQFKSFDGTKKLDGIVDVPAAENGTHVLGNCSIKDNAQTLVLNFFDDWSLKFTFKKNSSVKQYYLESVNIEYSIKHGASPFPEAEDLPARNATLTMDDDWVKELGSYMCFSQRVFYPPNSSLPVGGLGLKNLTVMNEHYQAFVNVSEPVFSRDVRRCEQDSVSNLVPIVVGAALCALIVIVLVAYLIGRHHKRGYESV